MFYHRFKDLLSLVPTLDCGDHTDFVGLVNGKLIRLDVTTKLETKHPEDYRRKYHYIVVYDTDSPMEEWKFFILGKDDKFELAKDDVVGKCQHIIKRDRK